jgi:hypothetical protein
LRCRVTTADKGVPPHGSSDCVGSLRTSRPCARAVGDRVTVREAGVDRRTAGCQSRPNVRHHSRSANRRVRPALHRWRAASRRRSLRVPLPCNPSGRGDPHARPGRGLGPFRFGHRCLSPSSPRSGTGSASRSTFGTSASTPLSRRLTGTHSTRTETWPATHGRGTTFFRLATGGASSAIRTTSDLQPEFEFTFASDPTAFAAITEIAGEQGRSFR